MKRKRKIYGISKRKLLQLKPILDQFADEVEVPEYIDKDPVLFLHAYDDKRDKELAGFFAAIMAWGRRDIVIAKVEDLMNRMNHRPMEFIGNFKDSDNSYLSGFKHRTFTDTDVYWLILALHRIVQKYGDFEAFWKMCYENKNPHPEGLMSVFHKSFFEMIPESPHRVRKHIANPEKKSSCKRLYLYLRWTVRKNSCVDTGIHDFIPTSELMLPLDVHVARHARRLGILTRHQNDWASVLELTENLKLLNPEDPARYDYALLGMGISDLEIPPDIIRNSFIT